MALSDADILRSAQRNGRTPVYYQDQANRYRLYARIATSTVWREKWEASARLADRAATLLEKDTAK